MQSGILRGRVDPILGWVVLVLVGVGLVMVFSASSYLGSGTGYLGRHLSRLIIGGLVCLGAARVRYTLWARLAPLLVLAGIGVLGFTLLAGRTVQGAKRWVDLFNLTLQPSEFAKLGMVFYLASYFARHPNPSPSRREVMPPMLLSGLLILLVGLQPNLGMAVALSLTCGICLWLGGVKPGHLLLIGLVGAVVFLGLVHFFPHAQLRMESFLAEPSYQVRQSILAVGSGEFWGRGLGGSRQKFLFLPQPHTDFIFSILAEETGFLGGSLVFLLFGCLFWRGCWIAIHIQDRLGRLLCGGLTGMISVYFLLHVGVVLGVLPPTGLPLPFISFGGSALITNLWAVGVVMNLSRYVVIGEVDESRDSRWRYRRPYLPGPIAG